MITAVHVRGAAHDAVVAAVTKQMEAEGYVVDPTAEEPRHLSLGVPAVRPIDIVEDAGWVSVVDHPFADTAWAKLLSSELAVAVVELAGECDHAFYSTALLFERGEERGASRVPEDAVLEDDGRHRIRPVFLAAVAPEARATLEAGIVVHDLGGEENVVAVCKALGIPRPLVRPGWDEAPGRPSSRSSSSSSRSTVGFVSSNGTVYEQLAGTSRVADKQEWLARHVRIPAWCVLAPSAAAARLDTSTSDRVCTTRTTHGLFAWSSAATPFAYTDADAEAMERFVLPAIGRPADA